MPFIFKGNLKAYLCDNCTQPLSEVKVLVYKIQDKQNETLLAVANTKETFRQVNEEEAASKKDLFLSSSITDEAGNFSITLKDSEYSGGAFDIDFECGTVPIKGPRPPKKIDKPIQFHLTTLQPLWKEVSNETQNRDMYAGWEHIISAKYFCWILKLLKIYIICGKVVDCKQKRGLPNIRVEAFDVDLIQDDPVGSAITDSTGNFLLIYDEASFSKTIFNWLNIEWPAGPDIYFKFFDASTNGLIFAEPRHTGHNSNRENRNNCWCVEICIDLDKPGNTGINVPAYFNAVGHYLIASNFNANGRTNDAEDNVFTDVLPLNGNLPPAYASNAIEYRFRIQRLKPDGTVLEEFIPRPENGSTGLIKPTLIGSVTKYIIPLNPMDPVVPLVEPYYLNKPGETYNVSIGAQGWIKVPRAENTWSGGMYQHSYPGKIVSMSNLDTIQLVMENFDLNAPAPPHVAGNTLNASDRFAGPDHTFKIICESREVSAVTPNPNTISLNILAKINIWNGFDSFFLTRHPGWNGGIGSYKGVCMMELQETIGNGCGKLNNDLHILYTCYHPYIADASMYVEGPTGNFGSLTAPINANNEASGSHFIDMTGKPNCAYIAWLTATYRITSGYGRLSNNYDRDHIAFCKG